VRHAARMRLEDAADEAALCTCAGGHTPAPATKRAVKRETTAAARSATDRRLPACPSGRRTRD
jgi:hypothetical protein